MGSQTFEDLYEELFASRRLRLHQQVAPGLEVIYARRLEEHASELAEHFAQSTDAADLQKAIPNLNLSWITTDLSPTELAFKVNEEPFKDVRVRRAISKAIDRKAIIDTLFFGHGVLTTGLSFPAADCFVA